MAAIPGSIPVTGIIAPTDTADTYPVTDVSYGLGGWREVADTPARDAIPAARRREGMVVVTQDTGTAYQLVGGITNGDWVAFDAATVLARVCDGRLNNDATDARGFGATATSLYYHRFNGDRIVLWNGSAWVLHSLPASPLTISNSGTVLSQMYDVFVRDNSGLELVLRAWSSDAARGYNLAKISGVFVDPTDNTQRYVGTVRTNAANQFSNLSAYLGIWNMYNRVRRSVAIIPALGDIAVAATSPSWRTLADINGAFDIEAVIGGEVSDGNEDSVTASVGVTVQSVSDGGVTVGVALGAPTLAATASPDAASVQGNTFVYGGSGVGSGAHSKFSGNQQAGFYTLSGTLFSTVATTLKTDGQSGMTVEVWN